MTADLDELFSFIHSMFHSASKFNSKFNFHWISHFPLSCGKVLILNSILSNDCRATNQFLWNESFKSRTINRKRFRCSGTSNFYFLCISMKKHYFSILFTLLSLLSFSQIGGTSVYSFLNVPASARIAALGGTFISVRDNDINSALQAPSLLNPGMNKSIALSGVTYVDGVKFGDASYAKTFEKLGTFIASMHYANYGDFKETDVNGDIQGSFKAADYALNIGFGYQYNERISLGAAIKGIYSDYYIYNAFGIAADISATYYDSLNQWTITAEARNIGTQLKNYVKKNNEPLPVEGLIAVSKRLAHTPLRFNLTYRHLEKFDMSYSDPYDLGDVDPLTGEAQVKTIGFFNKLSRHFILGTEILLSKNFHLRAAYNFQRRRELTIESRPGTVGFSFGFGIKISKFILSYGRGNYHLAGAANHFSISTNIAEFGKKK